MWSYLCVYTYIYNIYIFVYHLLYPRSYIHKLCGIQHHKINAENYEEDTHAHVKEDSTNASMLCQSFILPQIMNCRYYKREFSHWGEAFGEQIRKLSYFKAGDRVTICCNASTHEQLWDHEAEPEGKCTCPMLLSWARHQLITERRCLVCKMQCLQVCKFKACWETERETNNKREIETTKSRTFNGNKKNS